VVVGLHSPAARCIGNVIIGGNIGTAELVDEKTVYEKNGTCVFFVAPKGEA